MSPVNKLLLIPLLLELLNASQGSAQNVSFQSSSVFFSSIIGPNPKVTIIANSTLPLFHEAGVWYPPTRSLFLTSDNLNSPSIENNQSTALISVITGDLSSPSTTKVQTLNSTTHGIPFPNGGYRYLSHSNVLVWIGEGSLTKDGGVWFLNPLPPYNATQILSGYGNFPFNSPNDIAVTPSGEIYFTDNIYGSLEHGGTRPKPDLPNQVYRFDPSTGNLRAVADGFSRANGIGLNKDGSVVYIIDSGALVGDGTYDLQNARTVYAFDVQHPNGSKSSPGGLLGNRRLFAFPDIGGAKGVKTDTVGNVYLGVGDGVSVWNADGDLLGKILIEGGIANLGFGEPGVLFAMGDTILWRIDLSKHVIGSSNLI